MNILNNKNKRTSIFKALALCLFAAVSLTLASCDDDMDIQQSYPFTVETMPVPVQVFHRLAYVGDGVQHKAVAIAAYAECVSGQKVHEALEHAAYVRGGIFRFYQ